MEHKQSEGSLLLSLKYWLQKPNEDIFNCNHTLLLASSKYIWGEMALHIISSTRQSGIKWKKSNTYGHNKKLVWHFALTYPPKSNRWFRKTISFLTWYFLSWQGQLKCSLKQVSVPEKSTECLRMRTRKDKWVMPSKFCQKRRWKGSSGMGRAVRAYSVVRCWLCMRLTEDKATD